MLVRHGPKEFSSKKTETGSDLTALVRSRTDPSKGETTDTAKIARYSSAHIGHPTLATTTTFASRTRARQRVRVITRDRGSTRAQAHPRKGVWTAARAVEILRLSFSHCCLQHQWLDLSLSLSRTQRDLPVGVHTETKHPQGERCRAATGVTKIGRRRWLNVCIPAPNPLPKICMFAELGRVVTIALTVVGYLFVRLSQEQPCSLRKREVTSAVCATTASVTATTTSITPSERPATEKRGHRTFSLSCR